MALRTPCWERAGNQAASKLARELFAVKFLWALLLWTPISRTVSSRGRENAQTCGSSRENRVVWLLLKTPEPLEPSVPPPHPSLEDGDPKTDPNTISGVSLVGAGTAQIGVHPGRLLVADVEYDQLAGQFELDRVAAVYATLADAEIAVGDRPGFMLSLEGEFQDSRGRDYTRGVLFCPGVRDS